VAESPRKQLLVAFERCLKRIVAGAEYSTSLGAVVTLEPGQLDPEHVDDGIAVYVEKQERANELAVVRTHRLTTVAIVVKRRANAGAEAVIDAAVQDIEQALMERQTDWPVGYCNPAYQNMEYLRAPAGADWVGALLRYTSNIPIRNR